MKTPILTLSLLSVCIYEGPNESAIRKAAKANAIPVDSITEVPETLLPK